MSNTNTFRITLKDPDGVGDSVREAAEAIVSKVSGIDLDEEEREALVESKQEKLNELLEKWFDYGEYLTVEVDVEKKTIRVVPRDELQE